MHTGTFSLFFAFSSFFLSHRLFFSCHLLAFLVFTCGYVAPPHFDGMTRCLSLLRGSQLPLIQDPSHTHQVPLVLLIPNSTADESLSPVLPLFTHKPTSQWVSLHLPPLSLFHPELPKTFVNSAPAYRNQGLMGLKYHLHMSKREGRRNVLQIQTTCEINGRANNNNKNIKDEKKMEKKRMQEIAPASEVT